MTEFLFYHLEEQPLQAILPALLEKTLARSWRACVRFATRERLEAMDATLWTYRDDAFLPHGTVDDGAADKHPIALTLDEANPNEASVVFLLDDVDEPNPSRYARVVRIFNGRDEVSLSKAREAWRAAKASGFDASYWRQNAAGVWAKAG